MCLLAAAVMLPMIPLEVDEVAAMFQRYGSRHCLPSARRRRGELRGLGPVGGLKIPRLRGGREAPETRAASYRPIADLAIVDNGQAWCWQL